MKNISHTRDAGAFRNRIPPESECVCVCMSEAVVIAVIKCYMIIIVVDVSVCVCVLHVHTSVVQAAQPIIVDIVDVAVVATSEPVVTRGKHTHLFTMPMRTLQPRGDRTASQTQTRNPAHTHTHTREHV